MKILNKLTIRNLRLNKKRTIVTIIGIMLSTALICGVAGLVSSFQKSLINYAIKYEGNYHTTFKDVAKENIKYITENQKVDEYFITNELGWAKLEGSKNEYKPYLHILEYDKKALENYGVNLIEGRLPTNSNEILISEHIRTNGRVNLKIGDTITLDVGKRVLQDGTTLYASNPYLTGSEVDGTILEESIVDTQSKIYTIVGEIERLNAEDYSEPGYTCITYLENMGDKFNVSALYKNPKEYEDINRNISNNIGTDDYTVNTELLRYEGIVGDGTLRALYTIGGVVIFIIVVSSVFVIRNSFSISVSEKNRQYGMLSSIGATSKQIKKNVIFEGIIIGLIAIPLGLLLGIVAIMILLEVVNYLLNDMLDGIKFVYTIHTLPIIVSVIISLITIYLSCLIPAIRAAKISPIDSIRGNNDIKLKTKKVRTSKFTKKLFGIGGVIASKNLKRSKKKYRTTVISIVISIFIFISLSSFISIGSKIATVYYTDYTYNMYIQNGNKTIYEQLAKLDDVKDYAYYYQVEADIDANKYLSEFGKNYISDGVDSSIISIMAYNNEYFKQYIKEIGLKEDEYKTAAILIDDAIQFNEDESKTIERLYNTKSGEKMLLTREDKDVDVTISKNTDKRPMGLDATYYHFGVIVMSEELFNKLFDEKIDDTYDISNMFVYSEHSTELENTINDLIKQNSDYIELKIINLQTYVEQQKRIILVVSIFLYGFISVISLIGVTNIFNTITTNMILRSKEFAMLKSIGMTKKEFNRMIRLESVMYGTKALLIGIPFGILGSYGIYKSFALNTDFGYTLPITAIILSIIFVFIIVGITMKYSLSKINKQNIIETIRKDNI